MSPVDPADLIRLVAQGDETAFSKLYTLTAPRLYRLALLVTGQREIAEEALQDAFLQVWHGASGYDPSRGQLSTWMNVIVRRRCIDLVRRHGGRTQSLSDAEQAALVSELGDPFDAVALDSDARRLHACLQGLESSQRQALGMAYFQGLSHNELAISLKVPLGTLKSWIRRGLARLDKCLHHEL